MDDLETNEALVDASYQHLPAAISREYKNSEAETGKIVGLEII